MRLLLVHSFRCIDGLMLVDENSGRANRQSSCFVKSELDVTSRQVRENEIVADIPSPKHPIHHDPDPGKSIKTLAQGSLRGSYRTTTLIAMEQYQVGNE